MQLLNSLKLPTIFKNATFLPFLYIWILLLVSGCYRVNDTIDPEVHYTVQDQYLKQLDSPFPPLTAEERKTGWGKEYLIGTEFAKKLDLYRAITALKRSQILLPPQHRERREEIDYQIALSYYLGKRYEETLETVENSPLSKRSPSFAAHHDLLVILYESYQKTDQLPQAKNILDSIARYYPETAAKLRCATVLIEGNLPEMQKIATAENVPVDSSSLLNTYFSNAKSVSKAQLLNACIPGAGYFYVGQTQSAITAFLLNGLSIWATVYLFSKGNTAAGLLSLSFEAGWYFGGIYGAGEAAKLYNERLYESLVSPTLHSHKLFPVLMLQYGF